MFPAGVAARTGQLRLTLSLKVHSHEPGVDKAEMGVTGYVRLIIPAKELIGAAIAGLRPRGWGDESRPVRFP
jgi:hypothetical protein